MGAVSGLRGLDMDLGRDANSAFGSASRVDGGLLPYEGRSLMFGATGLPAAVFTTTHDGWLSTNARSSFAERRGSCRWRGEAA
ncbi:hypothetical protein ABMA10_14625 [Plantibacter sp. RU18]